MIEIMMHARSFRSLTRVSTLQHTNRQAHFMILLRPQLIKIPILDDSVITPKILIFEILELVRQPDHDSTTLSHIFPKPDFICALSRFQSHLRPPVRLRIVAKKYNEFHQVPLLVVSTVARAYFEIEIVILAVASTNWCIQPRTSLPIDDRRNGCIAAASFSHNTSNPSALHFTTRGSIYRHRFFWPNA